MSNKYVIPNGTVSALPEPSSISLQIAIKVDALLDAAIAMDNAHNGAQLMTGVDHRQHIRTQTAEPALQPHLPQLQLPQLPLQLQLHRGGKRFIG